MSIVAAAKIRRPVAKRRSRSGKAVISVAPFDRLKAFDGRADDLPAELARQHAHYLYGTPKQPAR